MSARRMAFAMRAAALRGSAAPWTPWTGAAIDLDFTQQKYWWGGAEKTQANFTTFALNGSTLNASGLKAADGTIDITLALGGLGSFVPGAFGIAYDNVSNGATTVFFELDNGTTQERVAALKAGSGAQQISIIDNNVTQANQAVAGQTAIGRHGFTCSYGLNSFLSSADGVASTPDVAGTLPTVTTLLIGKQAGSTNPMTSAWLRRLVLFAAVKTQAELDALSTALQST